MTDVLESGIYYEPFPGKEVEMFSGKLLEMAQAEAERMLRDRTFSCEIVFGEGSRMTLVRGSGVSGVVATEIELQGERFSLVYTKGEDK